LHQPERVTSIPLALKERRDERQASADRRIVDLARQAFEAEERLGRLCAAIEAGTIDGTDPSLKEAYLASIVDAVIVSESKIRIMGSNDNIRSTFGPKGQPTPVVRKSVQEWCAIQNKTANSYVLKLLYNLRVTG
jgi:site-specific DNA recombinase